MPGKDFDEKLALLQVRHHKSSQFFSFLSFSTLSFFQVQIYFYHENWVEIFLEKVIKWEDKHDAINDMTEKKRRGEERRKEERRGVDKIIPCRYIDHIILACKLPSIFLFSRNEITISADDDLHYCRWNTEIFLRTFLINIFLLKYWF